MSHNEGPQETFKTNRADYMESSGFKSSRFTPPTNSSPQNPCLDLRSLRKNVKRLFKHQNIKKASGPDNASSSYLRTCSDQLTSISTQIRVCSLPTPLLPLH
ncbi:hypothetical protein ILYODFUR_032731 [Ilyodon furcidens]|uniref:Uncharacterized protein n=1 Tax=Ilyodon furcidens TaxID=33524 RepID=A0ABV0SR27_9TELE